MCLSVQLKRNEPKLCSSNVDSELKSRVSLPPKFLPAIGLKTLDSGPSREEPELVWYTYMLQIMPIFTNLKTFL